MPWFLILFLSFGGVWAGERPWRKPDFTKQEKALGYSEGAFGIPAGMEKRVDFWLRVYTEFTSNQGLLHDSLYPEIVYQSLDFSDLMNDQALSDRLRSRKRRDRVKEAKKSWVEQLHKLAKLKGPEGLEGEDLRIWNLFNKVDEVDKFRKAAHNKRLRFQLGQKDKISGGIFSSGRYLERMESIFKEEALPIELTRLPFVESSFNLKARSKVGASGIWQFMRTTGRMYLKINPSVDERNDPLTATRAAARKLRENFQMLGHWPLAVTAYNHGPAGVARLTKKYQTENIMDLIDVRKGRFGFASANFYASFLAVLEAERNADKYYGNPKWDEALDGEEVILSRNIRGASLLSLFAGDLDHAKEYNPHLQLGVWKGYTSIGRNNFVRVPPTQKEALIDMLRKDSGPEPALASGDIHVVSSGETLSEIAMRFGVKVNHLMDYNGITNPRMIRPGHKLQIPVMGK